MTYTQQGAKLLRGHLATRADAERIVAESCAGTDTLALLKLAAAKVHGRIRSVSTLLHT